VYLKIEYMAITIHVQYLFKAKFDTLNFGFKSKG
jgi:hypothetical protein